MNLSKGKLNLVVGFKEGFFGSGLMTVSFKAARTTPFYSLPSEPSLAPTLSRDYKPEARVKQTDVRQSPLTPYSHPYTEMNCTETVAKCL